MLVNNTDVIRIDIQSRSLYLRFVNGRTIVPGTVVVSRRRRLLGP